MAEAKRTLWTKPGRGRALLWLMGMWAVLAVGCGSSKPSPDPVQHPKRPGAPTAVAATGGEGQAVVSWTAPADDGGSALTRYTVTASPGGATVSVAGDVVSATVGGLVNETAYTFTVVATNTVGDGPASAPSSPVTPHAAVVIEVPGAPTSVQAVAGDGQATVSWGAPAEDGGSPIGGYLITVSPGGAVVAVDGDVFSATVTGLVNGTGYTFSVVALNSEGSGPAALSNPVVPASAAHVPGAPTSVQAVAGDGQATVSWAAPADEGGSALTGFTVTASPGGATVTVAGSVLSATVTGLTNGTAYTFTVVATNGVGDGPASTPSDPATPRAPDTGSIAGWVSSGEHPLSGATVVAYAAGGSSGAHAQELGVTTTDASGGFALAFAPTPAAGAWIYLVARDGAANGASALMTVVGTDCLTGPGCHFPAFVRINERTTVAATAVLQRFLAQVDCSTVTGNTQSGTCVDVVGAVDLAPTAATFENLIDVPTGEAAGFLTAQPVTSPVRLTLEKLSTLANVLSRCVEAGVATAPECTNLFAQAGGVDDTLAAAVAFATSASINADGAGIFALQGDAPIYLPALAAAPADWTVAGRRFVYVSQGLVPGVDTSNLISAYVQDGAGALVPVTGGGAGACATASLPLAEDPLSCFPGPGDPSAIAVDPRGRFAFVLGSSSETVSAQVIDPATGALTPAPGTPFAGSYPIGVAVDPSGRFVYVANGYEGDSVSAYAVDADTGALTTIPGTAACGGPHDSANCFATGAYPFAVAVDPSGAFAYVANSGDNTLSGFAIDQGTGALVPLAGSPFPAGESPESLAIDPVGKHLFVGDFNGFDVAAYTIETTGSLTPVTAGATACQRTGYDTLDPDPQNCVTAGVYPEAIAVAPGGGSLYVVNNGYAGSPKAPGKISAYRVDGATGALTPVTTGGAAACGNYPEPNNCFPTGVSPSGVAIDASGRYVYVSNGGDGTTSAYGLDLATGALSALSGAPFASGSGSSSIAAGP